MRRLLVLLLPLAIAWGAVAAGEDPLRRHDQEVAGARQAYLTAIARAQSGFQGKARSAGQAASQALEQAARAAARASDLAGANAIWRELLRLDRGHPGARAHFAALGSLDAVLADPAATGPLPPAAAGVLDAHRRQLADARRAFSQEEQSARAAFRAAQDAARERALVALTAQGRAALAGSGDMAAASQAYRQALSLDRRVAVARDFFAKAGSLAAVLAELGPEPGDVLPPPPSPQLPDPSRSLLLVVGAPAAPSEGERALRERLEQAGWTVALAAKADAETARGVAGIVVTATASPANLDPALAASATGIAVMHPQAIAALLPGVSAGGDWKRDRGLSVVAGNALGLAAGAVQVYATPARMIALARSDAAVAHAAVPDLVARKPQPGDALAGAVRDHLKKQYGVDLPPEPAQREVPVAVMAALAARPAAGDKPGHGRRAALFPCSEDLVRLTPEGWRLLLAALAWTCQPPASAPASAAP